MNYCQVYAVIVAGGKGLRMSSEGMPSEIRKQYIKLSGIPVLAHTLKVFNSFKKVQHIALVVPEDDMDYCAGDIVLKYGFEDKVSVVSGGKERQDSVMKGLVKLSDMFDCSYRERQGLVLIHDAVRPFVDHDIISKVLSGAAEHGASVPVIPVVDTLKRGDGYGFTSLSNGTVDREELYQVQTPQAFDMDLILKAHEYALANAFSGTDDASLVEKVGNKVFMTPGTKKNIKITTIEDLQFAEYLMAACSL